jgi:hypothetical protein
MLKEPLKMIIFLVVRLEFEYILVVVSKFETHQKVNQRLD